MSHVIQRVRGAVPAVRQLMRYEPQVSLNFADADGYTITAVILCLIDRFINTEREIQQYLSERDCPFGHPTIRFLLDQFAGDDPRHHLWQRPDGGLYFPSPPATEPRVTEAC